MSLILFYAFPLVPVEEDNNWPSPMLSNDKVSDDGVKSIPRRDKNLMDHISLLAKIGRLARKKTSLPIFV